MPKLPDKYNKSVCVCFFLSACLFCVNKMRWGVRERVATWFYVTARYIWKLPVVRTMQQMMCVRIPCRRTIVQQSGTTNQNKREKYMTKKIKRNNTNLVWEMLFWLALFGAVALVQFDFVTEPNVQISSDGCDEWWIELASAMMDKSQFRIEQFNHEPLEFNGSSKNVAEDRHRNGSDRARVWSLRCHKRVVLILPKYKCLFFSPMPKSVYFKSL